MARRATVQPRWLDAMLTAWGRNLPEARGWYNVNPMLKSGIPTTAPVYDPWDVTPRDFDQMCEAISQLHPRLKAVIYMAYKPWTMQAQMEILNEYGVTQRTRLRWLQEAAREIEATMARHKEGVVA